MSEGSQLIIHDSKVKELKLSVIFACLNIKVVEEELINTIEILKKNKATINLIFVMDNESYESNIQSKLINIFPNLKVIVFKEQIDSMSILFNEGLKHVETNYVYFTWAGSFIDNRIFGFSRNALNDKDVYVLRNKTLNKVDREIAFHIFYGWLQSVPLYELNNIIVSKKAINEIGEFDTSCILQRYFYWEWILRLARNYMFKSFGIGTDDSIIMLENYPLIKDYEFSYDLIHRYVLRLRKLPFNHDYIKETEEKFLKDLNYKDLCLMKKNINEYNLENRMDTTIINSKKISTNKGYKVCIIGGPWEYHHIQITFLNYFDKMYGEGMVTYKIGVDMCIKSQDIKECDIVIICRSRNEKILEVIDYCNDNNIATMYMIDDNWLTIAKDIPELYGTTFIQGNSQYDTFIECLKKSKALITYNEYLYSDIKLYNECVYLFPLNIDLDYYKKTSILENDKIRIGYSGSLRHTSNAFKAICSVAKEYDNIEILYFGSLNIEQKKIFDGINTKFFPFQTYQIYCKDISNSGIDILIAPLDDNRYSKSKCPNKYLEIGAINGAGIYSNVYPYTEVINDGENGLLVKDNTVEEWKRQLILLYKDKELLNKIKDNCRQDVMKKYRTENHISEFHNMLKELKDYK